MYSVKFIYVVLRSVGMNTSARLAPARSIRRSNSSYELVEKGVHLYVDMAGSVPRSPVHHLVAEDGIGLYAFGSL